MSEKSIHINPQYRAVRNHDRRFSDFVFVYPVISRRSRGLSIGINLNPDKVCNFDCIYCEVDRRLPGRADAVDLGQIREELTGMVQWVREGRLGREAKFSEAPELSGVIKDFAFSGDGEPTMVNNFADCVRTVAEVKRAEGLDQTKIVLITNAAGLDKADVRRGLELMDANQGEIWGKLDAGTEAYYRTVNRTTIRFDRILANLIETAKARPIVIQSLFLKVHGQIMPEDELTVYGERLKAIAAGGGQIKEVHAYTIARPTPEAYATKLTAGELEGIADRIRRQTGLTVATFD
jgi:wyosine [tRNA(Phe)-imidazoG37] synthetase (radical SAM superfamily)